MSVIVQTSFSCQSVIARKGGGRTKPKDSRGRLLWNHEPLGNVWWFLSWFLVFVLCPLCLTKLSLTASKFYLSKFAMVPIFCIICIHYLTTKELENEHGDVLTRISYSLISVQIKAFIFKKCTLRASGQAFLYSG